MYSMNTDSDYIADDYNAQISWEPNLSDWIQCQSITGHTLSQDHSHLWAIHTALRLEVIIHNSQSPTQELWTASSTLSSTEFSK